MSIQPPSDIVLDVARAADPALYKAAAARLNNSAAAPSVSTPEEAAKFDSVLAETAGDDPPALSGGLPTPMFFDAAATVTRMKNDTALTMPKPSATGYAADAYRGFEAMVLSTFVEGMLPQSSEAVFGTGTAGQIWRSMLAQQVASEVAKAGGIGIADQLRDAASAAAKSRAS